MFFLTIIWSGVYLSHFLSSRTKLTPVLYFLAFGSLMVNMGVLPEESTEFIRGFSEIGMILIMFALGSLCRSLQHKLLFLAGYQTSSNVRLGHDCYRRLAHYGFTEERESAGLSGGYRNNDLGDPR